MTNEEYSLVVELNNKGASLLEAGEYGLANDAFLLAMNSMVQDLFNVTEEVPPSTEWKTRIKWSTNPSLKLPPNALPSAFIFQYAVHIEAAEGDAGTDGHIESASILWNIGLCFHIMGLSKPKSEYLKSALRFYSIACDIRRRGNDGSPELLDLALQNNIGQIHCEFMELTKARECFDLVSKSLTAMHQRGMVPIVDPEVCKGFVMNSVMAKQPNCSAAA